jgi:LPPG:FO 2-phospho-L-lactate transferase
MTDPAATAQMVRAACALVDVPLPDTNKGVR